MSVIKICQSGKICFTSKLEVITEYEPVILGIFLYDYCKSKKRLIVAEHKEEKDIEEEEAEMDEGRRRGSGVIEEFLVRRPAKARKLSSEGLKPRKVNEAKEEDGYEENVEEDVAVAANDEDDGKV